MNLKHLSVLVMAGVMGVPMLAAAPALAADANAGDVVAQAQAGGAVASASAGVNAAAAAHAKAETAGKGFDLSVGVSSTANNGRCAHRLRITGGTGADSYTLYVNSRPHAKFEAHVTVDATYVVAGPTLGYSLVKVKVGATEPVSSGTLSCSI
jgi:hypothetical protein